MNCLIILEDPRASAVPEDNMHPLIGDLKSITDNDLDEKITKIYKVLATSNNINVTRQAQMALDNYLNEQQFRNNKKLDDQFKKSGQKVEDVIDIS
jgi:hypothetical protein